MRPSRSVFAGQGSHRRMSLPPILARCGCQMSAVTIRVHDRGACEHRIGRHDHHTCASCGRQWLVPLGSKYAPEQTIWVPEGSKP